MLLNKETYLNRSPNWHFVLRGTETRRWQIESCPKCSRAGGWFTRHNKAKQRAMCRRKNAVQSTTCKQDRGESMTL